MTAEPSENRDELAYSVVIPLYNERDNIVPLAEELSRVMAEVGGGYEIIFVDDGSDDGSGEVLERVKKEREQIRVLRFDGNYGQSSALDAGFRAAGGEVIIMMDGDLQNDPRDIPMMLEELRSYHMVCGWRRNRQDPKIKLISSAIANFVRNRLSGEEIRDTGCSLKAFRKECFQRIKPFDGMHRFLPTLFSMEGFSVCQVPVSHRPRRFGKSKYNIRNRMLRSFIDLLAVRWMKKRAFKYRVL